MLVIHILLTMFTVWHTEKFKPNFSLSKSKANRNALLFFTLSLRRVTLCSCLQFLQTVYMAACLFHFLCTESCVISVIL